MEIKRNLPKFENFVFTNPKTQKQEFLIGKSLEPTYKNNDPLSIVIHNLEDIRIGRYQKSNNNTLILPFYLGRGSEKLLLEDLSNIHNFPNIGESRLFIYKAFEDFSREFQYIQTNKNDLTKFSYYVNKNGEASFFKEKEKIPFNENITKDIRLFGGVERIISDPELINDEYDRISKKHNLQLRKINFKLLNI